MNFIPLKAVNVTNVFPTEQAPFGLNYYAPIAKLPYSTATEWGTFLYDVYDATDGTMAGLKSNKAFKEKDWLGLGYPIDAHNDRLQYLGYNPIVFVPGIGPVIWGNMVEGCSWTLSQLMTGMRVVEDLIAVIDNIIRLRQLELFVEIGYQINVASVAVTNIIYNHRTYRNLYCSTLDEPTCYREVTSYGWKISVPIKPVFIQNPLTLEIRYGHKRGQVEYWIPKEFSDIYAMWSRLLLGGVPFDLHLEF